MGSSFLNLTFGDSDCPPRHISTFRMNMSQKRCMRHRFLKDFYNSRMPYAKVGFAHADHSEVNTKHHIQIQYSYFNTHQICSVGNSLITSKLGFKNTPLSSRSLRISILNTIATRRLNLMNHHS